MTAIELLSRLRGLGVGVHLNGDRLQLRAPKGVLTPEMRRELTVHRDEILALLRRTATPDDELSPIPRASREEPLPLSFAQQRLWFLDQLEPGGVEYNLSIAWRLPGDPDQPALRRALEEIISRHEVLRTTFIDHDGVPAQLIHPPAPIELATTDLTHLPLAEAREQAYRRQTADMWRPFNLAKGPLVRPRLISIAEDEHILGLTLHHILFDDWSENVMYREFSLLYAAFSDGLPSPLPPLTIQYGDYAVWQRDRLTGATLQRQLEYWRTQLADVPRLGMPVDHPRPPVASPLGAVHKFLVPDDVTEKLRELAGQSAASMFMVLLGAFSALLARHTGQDDIAVGTPTAGRRHLDAEQLIGFFVNTLVMRVDTSGDPTFAELLARVRRTALEAFSHQDVPFERLAEEFTSDRSRDSLFDIFFIFTDATTEDDTQLRVSDADVEASVESMVRSDLEVTFIETSSTLHCVIGYRAELFDRTTIRRLGERLHALLAAVATAPHRRLSLLAPIPENEHAELTDWGTGQATLTTGGELVHELIGERARTAPQATAVIAGERRLTYAEVEQRANRLAHHLSDLDAGPESVVGVLLERDPNVVVAMLAIWKSGAAYLPLDPEAPADRLAFLLADSQSKVLLTTTSQRDRLPGDPATAVVVLDDPRTATAIGRHPATPPPIRPRPDNAAYLIYTSGSTGAPKAVFNHHAGLVNRLTWQIGAHKLGATDRFLLKTPLTFDVSLWELCCPLLVGAAIVMVPPGQQRDPAALSGIIRDNDVTVTHFVPSMLGPFLDAAPARDTTLRLIVTSGEALSGPLAQRVHEHFDARLELHNLYGPTEASVDVTAAYCPPSADGPPPIGVPIANTRVLVLNEQLSPAPVGAVGELFIGGVQLARGYAYRPALTAERFVPDPSAEDGSRLYRTGDLVRWRNDGQLEFLGRTDQQIKIRGHRVEPGEIEATLVTHPQVRATVVIAREDVPGDKRLIAYVVPQDALLLPTVDEFRTFLKVRLPDHMIPGAFVTLSELPRGTSGKIDRRALPSPGNTRPDLAAGFHRPRTPTEKALGEIWCDVLGLDRVGLHDDFFELGGHSLLATRIAAQLSSRMHRDLRVTAVFNAPTLAGLAAVADATAGADPMPPITRVDDRRRPQPSFAQQRLWFLNRLEPDSTEYHIPLALQLTGPLDVDALRQALSEVVARHEILRTTFDVDDDGAPVQILHAAVTTELPITDLTTSSVDDARAETRQLIDADVSRPFDLTTGPVLRFRLIHLSTDEHVLAMTLHHIAFDEWSITIFTRELAELYAAFRDRRPSPFPELPIQYADFAAWQRQWFSDERLSEQLDYWRAQLADLPRLRLPTDRPRPAVRGPVSGKVDFTVGSETTQRLRQLARRAEASMFMTVLAAFQLLLSRHSGQDDIVVGSPNANRVHSDTQDLIGPFINLLVLRTDLSGCSSFTEVLARVRTMALDAYAHQDLPFEQLIEELQPDRDRGSHPLFQVILNYQVDENRGREATLADIDQCDFPTAPVAEKVDLRLAVTDVDGELEGEMFYNADLFDRTTIERMVCQFETLLAAVAHNPACDLATMRLLSEAERAELMSWTTTGALTRLPPQSVSEWISAQARAVPEAPAVVAGETQISYGDLEARANRLAHDLHDSGVGPEAVIALCLPANADLVVALLGVLRSGAAYLPLDPAAPLSRLAFQLNDSSASLLITTTNALDRLPAHPIPVLLIDEAADRPMVDERPTTAPEPVVDPATTAYLMYTSGSTGTPKAVAVTHAGLAAYVHHVGERLELKPGRYAVAQSAAVDFINTMVYGCLTRGGTLHLLNGEQSRDGKEFGAYLRQHRIDYLKLVPSQVAALLATSADPTRILPTTALVLGGEPTASGLADRLHALTEREGIALVNHYGPTETTVGATTLHVTAPPTTSTLPVGRPLPHIAAFVLDKNLQLVPQGVVGELFLGGQGLARGYHNRPALTSERFVADPFAADGSRLYRTGDLVRWLSDGCLEFLGRTDDQLKIRGYRVEPAEVEAALGAHRQVIETAVNSCDDGSGGQRLVAYVVSRERESAPSAGELRAHLSERLPDHAVPSTFVYLESLPRSAAGKIDRRALPPADTVVGATTNGYRAPQTFTEHLVSEIWSEALRVTRVGRDDDFFDLGGHSLLAARVIARLSSEHAIELPLAALFDAPTLTEFASLIDGRGDRRFTVAPLVPMNHAPSERAFFCVPPMSGSPFCYRILAQSLAPEIAFIGLQAPGVDDDQVPLERMEDLAAHYLAAIRQVQRVGPYFLGGWSAGCLTALEMAQQLVAAGEEVGFLGLIAPARLKVRFGDRQLKDVRSFIDDLRSRTPDKMDRSALTARIRPLACEPEFAGDPASIDQLLLLRRFEVIAANAAAKRQYAASSYPGKITVLMPKRQRRTSSLLAQWRNVAGRGMDVEDVPGSHQSIVMDDSNARTLAARLKARLSEGQPSVR